VYASISHSARQARPPKVGDAGTRLHVLATSAPQDVAVEGVRSLRTALQFRMAKASNNVVMITGPRPGVGKSFLSINLAAVMAAAGKRVLLIDADLRRGNLESKLGISRGPGLGDMLAGMQPQSSIRHAELPNLDVLTRGSATPNPAEILMSERFATAIKGFSETYDIVIVDTPPVLAVTDSTLIGLHAGTTLLAVRYGRHSAAELRESVRLLAGAGVEVSGIALGDVPARATAYGAFSSYESVSS
jgi:tyrosine-protein kinase Etk/Wzc